MFELFLTPEAGVLTLTVYAVTTFVKALVSRNWPALRESERFKHLFLPLFAALVGGLVALVSAPVGLSTLGARIIWGSVLGYLNSALYKQIRAVFPGEEGVERALSSRPPATIPAAPGYPDDSLRIEEESLP